MDRLRLCWIQRRLRDRDDSRGHILRIKWRNMNMEYIINFTWDGEADVWIATSNDIPGLVLESGSFDALIERTRFAIPELLELNIPESQPFSLIFKSERHERMVLHG